MFDSGSRKNLSIHRSIVDPNRPFLSFPAPQNRNHRRLNLTLPDHRPELPFAPGADIIGFAVLRGTGLLNPVQLPDHCAQGLLIRHPGRDTGLKLADRMGGKLPVNMGELHLFGIN